jgi:hypothetical protein
MDNLAFSKILSLMGPHALACAVDTVLDAGLA